jgi:hypothetical protein
MPSESAASTISQQITAPAAEVELSPQTAEYRKQLAQLETQSQESYDKTVIALSGGALGFSLVFLKDVAGPAGVQDLSLVVLAWLYWTISLGCVLWSFYSSRAALRWTIRQIDRGADLSKGVGGSAERATQVFNLASGATFIGGALAFVLFGFFSASRLP